MHIELHKDCRVKLDPDYIDALRTNDFRSDNVDHVNWAHNVHVDLFLDDEGVWLLPEDDSPLGNGAVLPIHVISDDFNLAALIDWALIQSEGLDFFAMPIDVSLFVEYISVAFDRLRWAADSTVQIRVARSGEWVDLSSLWICIDDFEQLMHQLVNAGILYSRPERPLREC